MGLEGQPADGRLQTVGTDHHIEPAVAAAAELHINAVIPVLQCDDLVVEAESRKRP